MKLIATWLKNQEPDLEDPHSVVWEDGQTATIKEFWEHSKDTRLCIVPEAGGLEWHLFPDVVAEVFWCRQGKAWGVRGDGVEPSSLYVTDLNASDHVLECALSAMPIVYRAKISRPIN